MCTTLLFNFVNFITTLVFPFSLYLSLPSFATTCVCALLLKFSTLSFNPILPKHMCVLLLHSTKIATRVCECSYFQLCSSPFPPFNNNVPFLLWPIINCDNLLIVIVLQQKTKSSMFKFLCFLHQLNKLEITLNK